MEIDAYGITYNQTGEDFLRKPIKQKAMCIRAGAGVIEINKCKENGRLGGKFEKMHEQSRRVYSIDYASPTLHTCGGGNQEIKIEFPIALDEQNKTLRFDYTVGTLTTDGSSPKHNNRILHEELCAEDVKNKKIRIRKLTERECFRLMGVKEKEFSKIKQNQSKSSLYHLAGDSIVTTCLMAIFGEMTDVDWENKINCVAENIKDKNDD